MTTVKCSKCQEDIQEGAKKCKHCGSDLRSWFVRHKIWTGILALMVIGLIMNIVDGPTSSTTPKTTLPASNENNVVTESNVEPSIVTEPVVEKKTSKISKENCDLVKTGMSGDEVKGILGEPKSTSESEIAGLGKTEYWQYQEGFTFQACSVILSDGKVSSKTWTDL